MAKLLPAYILLAAILVVFVLGLREIRAMRTELTGIRNEQLKQPAPYRPLRPGAGIPVHITNDPVTVQIER